MYNREDYNIEAKLIEGDFVALDFETVNVETGGFFGDVVNLRVPCQVGLVVIENGKVNEEKSLNLNIKPIGLEECYPISEFSLKWIATHTKIVEPEMQNNLDPKVIWANDETFDKVWPKMLELIGDKPIVAHMASVERSTIINACNHYGLSVPDSLTFVCTKLTSEILDEKYFGFVEEGQGLRTLTTCCSRYGIDFSEDEHHDAYSDAKVTALLMMKMRNGVRPISFDEMDEIEWPKVEGKPLQDKRIVLSGQFYIYQQKSGIKYRRYLTYKERETEFKDWLTCLGAKFTKSATINAKLNVFLIGEEPGWAKVKKVKELRQHGVLIDILGQKDINGCFKEKVQPVDETIVENPFKGKRVAIYGNFKYDISILRDRFRRLGANIDNISKNTNYVVLGHNIDDEKQAKVNDVIIRRGWAVRQLDENNIEEIMRERFDGLETDEEVKKSLSLNYEYHIAPNLLSITEDVNPVYEENVFIPMNIHGSRDLMAQILGNIGAYANDTITNASESDKTKPVIMLTAETIDKIKAGEKDDTIRYIEKIYNTSNANGLDYPFVEENTLLRWIGQRSNKCGDKYTLTLLSKYNEYQDV